MPAERMRLTDFSGEKMETEIGNGRDSLFGMSAII